MNCSVFKVYFVKALTQKVFKRMIVAPKGQPQTSLGQRPRYEERENRALKARCQSPVLSGIEVAPSGLNVGGLIKPRALPRASLISPLWGFGPLFSSMSVRSVRVESTVEWHGFRMLFSRWNEARREKVHSPWDGLFSTGENRKNSRRKKLPIFRFPINQQPRTTRVSTPVPKPIRAKPSPIVSRLMHRLHSSARVWKPALYKCLCRTCWRQLKDVDKDLRIRRRACGQSLCAFSTALWHCGGCGDPYLRFSM